MIGLEDRQALARDIHAAHAAGARLKPACETAGIDLRTLQRWQAGDGLTGGDRRPQAVRPTPGHALCEVERAHLLAVANAPRFASVPPARIVPMLADEGIYLASESTFSRVLKAQGQTARRGRARAPKAARPPTTHVASAPRQVWCWDMTYLPAQVMGRWFYFYLILDLYSRKIVGWEAHETDHAEHAAHLVRRTALAEGIAAMGSKPVLHGDNGSTLKATTVLAMLNWLGVKPSYSRPRVSDDNAYAESVSHRQVPARVPHQGFRRSRTGARLGGRFRALVQRRSSPQRHSLCQPGAAPCRGGSGNPRCPTRLVSQGPRAEPGTLVGQHSKLVAHRRRHAQSGTGFGHKDASGGQ
ncbi:hypothetical protein MASR1M97_28500 [Candidatus Desulfobacillus denitrificans]